MSRIAIIGGTGDMGRGLALRLATNHEVIIGSRDEARARKAAEELAGGRGVSILGLQNSEAASKCDAAILAIPNLPDDDLLQSLRSSLAGKLVVSPIVPMAYEKGVFSYTLHEGSAAERVAQALKSRVVAALQNVPSEKLLLVDEELQYDVLVAADRKDDFSEAAQLITSIKRLRPLYCGALNNARTIESLTPLLLNAGRQNRIRSPSIRLV